MLADRHVKIVGTIGPATQSPDMLEKLIRAGLNVARLNFSHGSHKDHLQVIQSIRKISSDLNAPVSLLQDLQGPKIRVGKLEGDQVELAPGDVINISPDVPLGNSECLSTDFEALAEACDVGTRILLDDGLIELRALRVLGRVVETEVVFGGILKSRKGMNLPGANLPVDPMTEKDLEDLEFGLEQKVDYVALSFVRQADDMKRLREIVEQKSPTTRIVAKIEMLEAIENLDAIISQSDAVMVARGDLAVEVGQTQLPALQKRIIKACNRLRRPVITATQMLDSMTQNPRPTRAEVTDVANAVIDGSDALMLSAESASGKYPVKAVSTMHEIIAEVEKDESIYHRDLPSNTALGIPEAIAASASLCAKNLQARAIVSLSTTGRTALLISAYRPKARIIAITHVPQTMSRLQLAWGVQTFALNPYHSTDEALAQVEELLLRYGLVDPGDQVVLTLGVPVTEKPKTNSVRVYRVRDLKLKLEESELPLRCQKINPKG